MAKTKHKRTSVTLIIIWMIFFFPVGVYFIYKRMTEDKTETLKNSKKVYALGWILIALGIMYFSMALTGQLTTDDGSIAGMLIMIVVLFFGGGFWTLSGARNMNKRGRKYNQYISVINAGETDIDIIAGAVSVTYETALKDIQELIDIGFFPNAYINASSKKLVLVDNDIDGQQITLQTKSTSKSDLNRKKVIKCSTCGANMVVIEGEIIKCEYCGTLLAYEA